METLKELLDLIGSFKDSEISWTMVILASFLMIISFVLYELYMYKVKSIRQNLAPILYQMGIAELLIILIIWSCGPKSFLFAVIFGILVSVFIMNKYVDFIKKEPYSSENIKNQQELQRLKRKFKGNPYFSILEVLLYYDYISPLHKEYIETENIFDSPEQMAEKLLTLPVLTERQLDEAKAIMNVIRMEGQILTKQDALLLVAKFEERRAVNEES